MELGQADDLEQLLLGGSDPLFFDFLGGVAQGRDKGAAVLVPQGLRCLDSTHAAGCTMCVLARGFDAGSRLPR